MLPMAHVGSNRLSNGSVGSTDLSHLSLVTLPMAPRSTPSRQLLLTEHANLRCIDWATLSKELMKRSSRGGQGQLPGDLFDLSRPVHTDEKVDYFMSHSWYDDVDAKWTAQEGVSWIPAEAWKRPYVLASQSLHRPKQHRRWAESAFRHCHAVHKDARPLRGFLHAPPLVCKLVIKPC